MSVQLQKATQETTREQLW